MARTINEINDKIRAGKVVVITAEEAAELVKDKGVKKAAAQVDVVTTGTFSPMCSSGAMFNLMQTVPKMKLGGGSALFNDVPAYTGLAAADVYLGANALPLDAPKNRLYPGLFKYGGAHVICELAAGKKVRFVGEGYGTDCYPKKRRVEMLGLEDFNDAFLFNPRNCYQNYNVAVNVSDKTVHTYMGTLQPRLGNANFCSAGVLSPLLKDPQYRAIGLGTRIFLGGTVGYVVWPGTQHNPDVPRTEAGAPMRPAATLAVMGDLKQMSAEWLRPVSFTGYGVSLSVSLGVPIPIVDEQAMLQAALTEEELFAPIVDYSEAYPQATGEIMGEVSYAELRSGKIEVNGKPVTTGCFSSFAKARLVAGVLKEWIRTGRFELTEPVAFLPGSAAQGGE